MRRAGLVAATLAAGLALAGCGDRATPATSDDPGLSRMEHDVMEAVTAPDGSMAGDAEVDAAEARYGPPTPLPGEPSAAYCARMRQLTDALNLRLLSCGDDYSVSWETR